VNSFSVCFSPKNVGILILFSSKNIVFLQEHNCFEKINLKIGFQQKIATGSSWHLKKKSIFVLGYAVW